VKEGNSVQVSVEVADPNAEGGLSTLTFNIGPNETPATLPYTHGDPDAYIETEGLSAMITGISQSNTGDGGFEALAIDAEPIATPIVDTIDTVLATLTSEGSGTGDDGAVGIEGSGSITYTISLSAVGHDLPVTPQTTTIYTVELSNGQFVDVTIAAGSTVGSTTVYWGEGTGDIPLDPDPDANSEVSVVSLSVGANNYEDLQLLDDTAPIVIPPTPPIIFGEDAAMMYNFTGSDVVQLKPKGGLVTLVAGGQVHFDLLLTNADAEDFDRDALLTINKLPPSSDWSYDILLDDVGGTDALLVSVYVSATTDNITLDPNDQFSWNLEANSTWDGSLTFINSDDYIRPHANNNFDYSTAERFDWLSSDVDGGELAEVSGLVHIPVEGETFSGNDAVDDIVFGTIDNDILYGAAGEDVLDGRSGQDELYGEDGADVLLGGLGDDILVGGEGDDLLIGGGEDDLLTGGEGSDTFAWESGDVPGSDTITDFSVGTDSLDLSDLLVGTSTDLGSLIQTALDPLDPGYDDANAELSQYFSVTQVSPDTIIQVDIDASGDAGKLQTITLEGVDTTDMDLASILNQLMPPPTEDEGGVM
jgi:Ca2+-binding RTX toxin-like protein